ncbi:hypothetical protein C8C76_1639 [Halanaerobium saccharolyticum]|uniref:Uncharacterized protein n=1 Tax=Halanaerobium saccharolyticum TaxID=43595 RepID=A0A2T5RF46_9FIRM|nr:hypothetical protein [Halanaerobium saccharolyticum]PTV92902.1 hypothetical protein C8C76_1639 [Halanaerobium saccharolyticum]
MKIIDAIAPDMPQKELEEMQDYILLTDDLNAEELQIIGAALFTTLSDDDKKKIIGSIDDLRNLTKTLKGDDC